MAHQATSATTMEACNKISHDYIFPYIKITKHGQRRMCKSQNMSSILKWNKYYFSEYYSLRPII